jgi:ankyrin repeat protein
MRSLPITRLSVFLSLLIIGGMTLSDAYADTIKAHDVFPSRLNARLADATATRNLDEVEKLIVGGADINGRGQEGITILIWTLLKGQKDSCELLLKKGANPDLQMKNGNSALTYAAMSEDTWWLETCIKYGGDPNLYNSGSQSIPIFDAISSRGLGNVNKRDTNGIKALARLGAKLDVFNAQGNPPLQYAVNLNQYDAAYELLQLGADPTLENKWGHTIVREIESDLTLHGSNQYEWRKKVIGLLKAKGIAVRAE